MKKALLLVLSLMLTLSLACPVWAGSNEETVVYDPDSYLLENDLPSNEGWIQPGDIGNRSSNSIAYTFEKTSATTCIAKVAATRPSSTSLKSTIKIQIKNGNTYNTISNGTAVKTVSSESIYHSASFSISSRKVYRVKFAIQYTQSGTTTVNYYYAGLDSNGF